MDEDRSDIEDIAQASDEAEYELPELSDFSEVEQDEAEKFALKVIKAAASLKVIRIDRGKFLRTELKKHCPNADIDRAVAETPGTAGISPEVLDAIAVKTIDFETKKCAALSFAAGIPGGLALAATVPADLSQYFAHVMRVEQKLAYIYGWQSFLEEGDEVDDETLAKFIMLLGVMMNVGGAANTINAFANNIARVGVQKAIQKQALTKTAFYPILKKVLRVVGVQLTKETFAKGVSKVVPVVGGLISGGVTYATFKPGAETLRKHLRELPCSGIEPGTPDIKQNDVVADATHALTDGAAQVGALAVGGAAAVGGAVASGAAAAGDAIASGVAAAGDAVAAGAAAAGDAVAAGAAAAGDAAIKAGAAAMDGAANIGKFFGSFGRK